MLLFADGFEHYGTDTANMLAGLWSGIQQGNGGIVELSTTVARTGTKSLRLRAPNFTTPSYVEGRFALGTTALTCGFGLGVYMPNLPSGAQKTGFQFRNASNVPILTGCYNPDGSIELRKGDYTGALIDVSDAILTAGTFNHVETKATFDSVAGFVEVRVNGVTKLQLGSLNLGNVGAATCAVTTFESGTGDVYYDDIYAWDDSGTYNNDFMGAQRILTLFPTGDTAQADFSVVGAASGYQAINQAAPDGDTSYIYSTAVNDKSDFSLPTLPPELVSIAGVFVPAMARLDAAGIGNLKMSMKSGASLLAGADNPLTPGYTYYRNVFEYAPDISAPWTKAKLEAALIRVEKSL